MSGGHSVIQNNCHYIFIYSFCATPLNYHGYNLKGFRQTFIWSQHTNVNLRVNYGCTEPLSLKEKMQMELRERHPEMSELGAELWAHALLRSASGSPHGPHTRQLPHALHYGPQTPTGGHSTAVHINPQTCQVKTTSGEQGKVSCRCILVCCWGAPLAHELTGVECGWLAVSGVKC